MNLCAQFLIFLIIIIYVLYLAHSSTKEGFGPSSQPPGILPDNPDGMEVQPLGMTGQVLPGHGLRHPQRGVVSSMINDYLGNPENAGPIYSDPYTIRKLKQTIRADGSRETATKIAYNDIGAYRPGGVHPFNESGAIVSQTQAESPVYNADMFENPYYQLWEQEQNDELIRIADRENEMSKKEATCVNFKNVNQCMSVCSNSPDCVGFYVDKPASPGSTGTPIQPGKCCMLLTPPYAMNRHSYNRPPFSLDSYGLRTMSKLVKRDRETNGKLVFDYIRSDGQNGTYKVALTREQCKDICPKCIMGRCPIDYRCTNMTADPRYNEACIITNEDRYDENNPNLQFDSPYVPYLDATYQLDEYAGYDPNVEYPVLSVPETERYYLDDRILPTYDELQSAYRAFDENHVGPWTYHASFNRDYDPYLASSDVDQLGTRGGNDPIGINSQFARGPYYPTNRTVPHVDPHKKN
jgi:hypothetical protein